MRAAATGLLLAGALVAPLAARAGCEDVGRTLFGIALGPMEGYVDALRPGLRREGTARLVPDVGFESLSGTVDGVAWERVLAFDDHGRFYSLVGVGDVPTDADHGLQAITRRLAQAAGVAPSSADGRTSFACAAPYELAVETRAGESGPRVVVSLADTGRRAAAQRFVQSWCEDPAHKGLPSACAKAK